MGTFDRLLNRGARGGWRLLGVISRRGAPDVLGGTIEFHCRIGPHSHHEEERRGDDTRGLHCARRNRRRDAQLCVDVNTSGAGPKNCL